MTTFIANIKVMWHTVPMKKGKRTGKHPMSSITVTAHAIDSLTGGVRRSSQRVHNVTHAVNLPNTREFPHYTLRTVILVGSLCKATGQPARIKEFSESSGWDRSTARSMLLRALDRGLLSRVGIHGWTPADPRPNGATVTGTLPDAINRNLLESLIGLRD